MDTVVSSIPSRGAALCFVCAMARATHNHTSELASGRTLSVPLCDECGGTMEAQGAHATLMRRLEPYRTGRPKDVLVRAHYRRRPQRFDDVLAELTNTVLDLGVRIGGEDFVNNYIESMDRRQGRKRLKA